MPDYGFGFFYVGGMVYMDCPFVNQDRPLCSERLNMQRLEDAYELCMDNFMFCPVYLLLSRRESRLAGVGAGRSEREFY